MDETWVLPEEGNEGYIENDSTEVLGIVEDTTDTGKTPWKKHQITPRNNQLFESKCPKIVQHLFFFLVLEQFV